LSLLFLYSFWLWNCIDFTLWMTIRSIADYLCRITANCLFNIIENIIEPNISIEKTVEVMFWFITLPFIIMNLLLTILPSFHNYRNTIIKTTTGCCSSGRHGKEGRQSDRHHVWWHGSLCSTTNPQNNHSPRTKYCVNQNTPWQKAYLFQYFDPLIIPPSITIIEDDVFYDSIYNQSYSPLRWKSPDSVPSLAITKEKLMHL
jgi:hypothetical protein